MLVITIFPDVAPAGTTTTICVAVVEIMVAVKPLNVAVAPDKFPALAFMVTVVPTGPEVGKTLEIAGGTQATIP